MTVLRYMAELRARIRAKYSGEELYFRNPSEKNTSVKLKENRPASVILKEIDSLKGLNTAARAIFARADKCANESNFAV